MCIKVVQLQFPGTSSNDSATHFCRLKPLAGNVLHWDCHSNDGEFSSQKEVFGSLNDSLVESGDLYFIVQAHYQYFHHI